MSATRLFFNELATEKAKVRLIIFDLDGTLLNTLDDLCNCTNYILQKYGHPQHPRDAYRYFVGNGIRKLIERALPEESRTEAHIEVVFQDFLAYYAIHKMDATTVYQGINSLLKHLESHGILVAVASNKAHEAMDELMRYYFPEIRFAAVLGNRKGCPIKPAPDIVFDILKMTHTAAANTLYAGDTATDMQTAARAGIKKIGVLWGFRDKEELVSSGADFLAEVPEDILRIAGVSENNLLHTDNQ